MMKDDRKVKEKERKKEGNEVKKEGEAKYAVPLVRTRLGLVSREITLHLLLLWLGTTADQGESPVERDHYGQYIGYSIIIIIFNDV